MNKQVILGKILNTKILKKCYYVIKHNHIDGTITLKSQGRLIRCHIYQDKGCVGNQIIIENDAYLTECTIQIHGNNNIIEIGSRTQMLKNHIIVYDDGNLIHIGCDINSGQNTKIVALEGKSITIGDNCLLSYDIEIRNSDSHTLLDSTGNRINNAADVYIGKHVWIAQRALVLKGARIGDNCVVSANAVVTNHNYDNNSLIVGIPGRVTKSGISWDINRL